MKSRILFLTIAGVCGFLWLTSRADWNMRALARPLLRAGLLWSEPGTVHGSGLSADELNNIDIYRSAKLATVYITSTTYKRDIFYQQYQSKSLGSGFLINDTGYILTNYHVISGSARIEVTLGDQKQYVAKPLDTDRSDDLALIKITPKAKQPFLRLGDSDHLQVGQKVLAIGDPFGLEGTLTTGVVSSIGRTIQSETSQQMEGMIQTDAAINGGNSGGPLLNSAGDVIGINTAILGQTNLGIGFALPINRAKALLADYQAGRVTERPKLGVVTDFVAGDLADALNLPNRGGLLIRVVQRNSSAAAAGLRGATQAVIVGNMEIGVGGDFILEIDGQPVDREDAITRIMAHKRVGDTVELTIVRNERKMKVPVKLLRNTEDSPQ